MGGSGRVEPVRGAPRASRLRLSRVKKPFLRGRGQAVDRPRGSRSHRREATTAAAAAAAGDGLDRGVHHLERREAQAPLRRLPLQIFGAHGALQELAVPSLRVVAVEEDQVEARDGPHGLGVEGAVQVEGKLAHVHADLVNGEWQRRR